MEKIIHIEGMGCAHCEAKVQKALEAVPQVESAVASKDLKNAVVTLKEAVADDVLVNAVKELKKFTVTGIE